MSEEENLEQQFSGDRPQSTENDTVSEPSIINEQPRPTVSSGRASTENMGVHKHPHLTKKNRIRF